MFKSRFMLIFHSISFHIQMLNPQYFYWLPSLLHPLTSLVAPLLQYPHPHLHEHVRKLYYISSSYISLWFSFGNGVIHTLNANTVYHTNLIQLSIKVNKKKSRSLLDPTAATTIVLFIQIRGANKD